MVSLGHRGLQNPPACLQVGGVAREMIHQAPVRALQVTLVGMKLCTMQRPVPAQPLPECPKPGRGGLGPEQLLVCCGLIVSLERFDKDAMRRQPVKGDYIELSRSCCRVDNCRRQEPEEQQGDLQHQAGLRSGLHAVPSNTGRMEITVWRPPATAGKSWLVLSQPIGLPVSV